MSKAKKTVIGLILFFIFFISSHQLLLVSGMYKTHDSIHVSRVVEMTQALRDGDFPVRWTKDFGFGYGMPLFEFYAPLPYYVGSFFYWLGFEGMTAVKLLYLISSLVTLIGAYKLGAKLFGPFQGVILAAAFTLAPYRAVNLFVRGALSESWGMMAMPWILYFILETKNQKAKNQKFLLTLGLVVLMLSHNLTTLMFVPVSFLFGLFYVLKDCNFKIIKNLRKIVLDLINLSSAYLLAIGLSAFYLFPAIIEKNFTQIGTILSGYFHYSFHFLYIRQFFQENWKYGGSIWGAQDDISFFLGYPQLLGFFLTAIIGLVLFWKNRKRLLKFFQEHSEIIFYLLIFIFCLYLSLLKSKWLWDKIAFFEFIQFPWRFLSMATLFLALIIAYGFKLIKSKSVKWVLGFGFLVLIAYNAKYFQFKSIDEVPWDYTCTDRECISYRMSEILPDYIPTNLSKEAIENIPEELASCPDSDCEIEVLVDRNTEKLVKTKNQEGKNQKIVFNVADYPKWQLEIDGEKSDALSVNENGLLEADISDGDHLVAIYLTPTNVRRVSDIVSFLSLVIFLLINLKIKQLNPND